jgi:pimeloyl-ACP methyl ester carboxylesterase
VRRDHQPWTCESNKALEGSSGEHVHLGFPKLLLLKIMRHIVPTLAFATSLLASCATPNGSSTKGPLVLQEQGSFAVGGRAVTDADGRTFHGDHAYVSYQVPVNPRKLPLVLWHGAGQSAKTWESTPDGREGYASVFLRRGFSVYTIDQPRRGRAGRSTQPITISPVRDEQTSFNIFRIGVWPNYFPGVQFSSDPAALEQYFRQMTPNTGPYDAQVNADAAAALLAKIGPAVLVTHSQGGGPGWLTAMKSRNVRGIISYEPGSGFVFPEGQVPAPMPSSAGTLEGTAVPMSDFMQLTRFPIVVYFGDNIPSEPTPNAGQDNWRVRLQMAKLWRDAVNRAGGDVTIVHLPESGIRGNTHFPFSDLNSMVIADLMSSFLTRKGLD